MRIMWTAPIVFALFLSKDSQGLPIAHTTSIPPTRPLLPCPMFPDDSGPAGPIWGPRNLQLAKYRKSHGIQMAEFCLFATQPDKDNNITVKAYGVNSTNYPVRDGYQGIKFIGFEGNEPFLSSHTPVNGALLFVSYTAEFPNITFTPECKLYCPIFLKAGEDVLVNVSSAGPCCKCVTERPTVGNYDRKMCELYDLNGVAGEVVISNDTISNGRYSNTSSSTETSVVEHINDRKPSMTKEKVLLGVSVTCVVVALITWAFCYAKANRDSRIKQQATAAWRATMEKNTSGLGVLNERVEELELQVHRRSAERRRWQSEDVFEYQSANEFLDTDSGISSTTSRNASTTTAPLLERSTSAPTSN